MKRFGKPSKVKESNTILVSNIPASKNAISHVYNYFKKYGRINSIWVEGTEAIIVYDSIASATESLNDPMSLMNNRFIKIQYLHDQNKCKANLKQYIDTEKVDRFSKEVEDNIQELLQKTEQLKKEFFEQNKTKSLQYELSPEMENESDEEQENEKETETTIKINELQKQKTKLVIEVAKMAHKYKSNDENDSNDFQQQIQSYKDQIEEIQAKIDLYTYEENNDANKKLEEDKNDEEIVYKEVGD